MLAAVFVVIALAVFACSNKVPSEGKTMGSITSTTIAESNIFLPAGWVRMG